MGFEEHLHWVEDHIGSLSFCDIEFLNQESTAPFKVALKGA
jgi:hypothetical protein